MPRLGQYDHLNRDTPLRIETCGLTVELVGEDHMEALVRAVCNSNYALHRFLSAFVRQNAGIEYRKEACDLFRDFLERGGY